MTDEKKINPVLVVLTDAEKVEDIKSAMDSRTLFDTVGEAVEAMEKAASQTENFHGLPIAIKGMNDEGEIDPATYEGCFAVLSYVGARVESTSGKKVVGIRSIQVTPMPKLEAFMASEDGLKWLSKIAEKELSHVAFRSFRESATMMEFQQGVERSPGTVEDFIAEHASSTGIDTKTFDMLWAEFRKSLKKQKPKLYAALPAKGEVLKSIRSRAYAVAEHSLLESKNIFVGIANMMTAAALGNTAKDNSPQPLDVTAFESWLAGRDTLVLQKAEQKELTEADLEGIDLDFAE